MLVPLVAVLGGVSVPARYDTLLTATDDIATPLATRDHERVKGEGRLVPQPEKSGREKLWRTWPRKPTSRYAGGTRASSLQVSSPPPATSLRDTSLRVTLGAGALRSLA